MCCQNLWKKAIPFTLTLMLGFSAVDLFQKEEQEAVSPAPTVKVVYSSGVGGKSSCRGTYSSTISSINERDRKPATLTPIKIIAKPRPNYTDLARQGNVQGTVTLQVTFLANGNLGSITPVNTLPNGLTEQAIEAARNIKFEPAKKNGVPYSISKRVQYNFTLY